MVDVLHLKEFLNLLCMKSLLVLFNVKLTELQFFI